MINGPSLTEHIEQGHSLTPDPYVHLFEFQANPGNRFYLTTHPTVEWNGYTWECFPIQISGEGVRSSGEFIRPSMQLGNNFGTAGALISGFLAAGQLYQAWVRRYKVLLRDLEAGNVNYLVNFWDVNRVASLNMNYVVLELHSPMDRQEYKLPTRQYFPPEFPYVKLR